jgi:branched-chain amino acid transport system substrate-binding protein
VIARAAYVLVALAAVGTCAAQTKVSDGVVKIGVLTDMTGVYADGGGAGSVLAVEMAVEDFKARYRPDFRIEVVFADHQNRADVGLARAASGTTWRASTW